MQLSTQLSTYHNTRATIIATSLPDESLSAVHESLSKKLSAADSHKSVSINEAIVSAQAREAHHQSINISPNNGLVNGNTTSSQLKQKQLEKEIEQRALKKAQERMELELKAMKEQLQRKEKERMQKESIERDRIERDHKKEFQLAYQKWKSDAAKELLQQQREEETKETMNGVDKEVVEGEGLKEDTISNNDDHHPILGPQIANLPYKRVHLTSAATLASLPVYEKQRAYRHDRAAKMAKDKKKTLWMGIPGAVALYEEDDGRLSILDGQHRVGMMALLKEEQRKNSGKGNKTSQTSEELDNLDLDNIVVEVFFPRPSSDDSVSSSSGQEQDDKAIIFTEINKAEPVKLIDLPGVTSKSTRDIIDHASTHFYDTHPAMFSPSARCRAPHLHLDSLRDALFASDILSREKIGSGGELVKWIVQKNSELGERYGTLDNAELNNGGKKVSASALKKARKHDFYLGLESSWLYK